MIFLSTLILIFWVTASSHLEAIISNKFWVIANNVAAYVDISCSVYTNRSYDEKLKARKIYIITM